MCCATSQICSRCWPLHHTRCSPQMVCWRLVLRPSSLTRGAGGVGGFCATLGGVSSPLREMCVSFCSLSCVYHPSSLPVVFLKRLSINNVVFPLLHSPDMHILKNIYVKRLRKQALTLFRARKVRLPPCNTLQQTATYCNTLNHTATH